MLRVFAFCGVFARLPFFLYYGAFPEIDFVRAVGASRLTSPEKSDIINLI